MSLLETALRFVGEGCSVFPLQPRSKAPFPGSRGFKDATFDHETISGWLSDETLNYGIVPSAEILVIDVDPRNGGDLVALEKEVGALPPTVTVKTGGGGTHAYYRKAGGWSGRPRKTVAGIDLKLSNGYVVGPGSVHPSGGAYAFMPGLALGEIAIAEAPAGLVQWFEPEPERKAPPVLDDDSDVDLGDRRADFTAIENGCAWVASCRDQAADLPEPQWKLLANLTARCDQGFQHFHRISSLDPTRYDRLETTEKFQRARDTGYRPPLCASVQAEGFTGCTRCPFSQTIKSPMRLGYRDPELTKIQATSVYDAASDRWVRIDREPFTYLPARNFSNLHKATLKSPHDELVSSPLTCKVEATEYIPGEEMFSRRPDGRLVLNTWCAGGIAGRSGNCDGILAHLRYLTMSEREYEHLLDYLAHLVQFPALKIRHAVLIISRQGVGKSFFPRVARHLFGASNVQEDTADAIQNNFWGRRLVDKQYLILNEMMLGDDDQRRLNNKMKELLSEDHVIVEEKHIPAYSAMTPRGIFAFSNHDRPIKLERGDRRLFVIRNERDPKPADYYKGFYGMVLDAEAAAFKAFLETRSLAHFSAGAHPPMTEAKYELEQASRSELEQSIATWIEDKVKPFEVDLVSADEVAAQMSAAMGTRSPLGVHGRVTSQRIATALTKIGAIRYGSSAVSVCGDPAKKKRLWIVRDHRFWQGASLQEVRNHLNSTTVERWNGPLQLVQ
ncbi:bifunctional DNA primase/polymerase [Oharaeibacter diazotrophicus]|uniref:Bifunctional DNA primase/polymerase-like protein n=3 Tax=Oharaeibacter diazotrophicus TaxID=1920512 RepID=A0A4V3CX38_9HYPH|nr:bifunctional DNA primase/polymerase [Oharaeibacter diazotrophicus]TDP88718.1 bifunctional DNA primase/polymerase-like protein [Oharaeibacter diazotrophicus]